MFTSCFMYKSNEKSLDNLSNKTTQYKFQTNIASIAAHTK